MTEINDLEPCKVVNKVSPFVFEIGMDSTKFNNHEMNGIVVNVKVPHTESYHNWATSFNNPVASTADGMLPIPDLSKFGRGEQLHCALGAIIEFCKANGKHPTIENAAELVSVAKTWMEKSEIEAELEEAVIKNAVSFCGSSISPIAAFFGGIVA
jgi:hypothetical protein